MKKGYIRLLIACFIFIGFFILNGIFALLNTYTLIFAFFILTIGLYYYLGYEKDNQRHTKNTMLNILIYSIGYIIITNLLGLLVGFYSTVYNLSILSILGNIIPIIIIIILSEIVRYIIITKGSRYITIQILTVLMFILLDMLIFMGNYKNISREPIELIISVILPSISKNIMLTYLASKVGYRPAILYRALFELPVYILPIFPKFGLYVGSIIQTLSHAILMGILYYSFLKTNFRQKSIRQKNKTGIISFIITGIILILMLTLTSGWFKYYAITIGSGSMKPTINEGDVVIVKKLNNKEIKELQEGEILLFNYEGKMLIHRIVTVVQVKDDYYFYTKGDNNETEDGYPIETKDIIGTTSARIPYLGYPTLWLQRLVK